MTTIHMSLLVAFLQGCTKCGSLVVTIWAYQLQILSMPLDVFMESLYYLCFQFVSNLKAKLAGFMILDMIQVVMLKIPCTRVTADRNVRIPNRVGI